MAFCSESLDAEISLVRESLVGALPTLRPELALLASPREPLTVLSLIGQLLVTWPSAVTPQREHVGTPASVRSWQTWSRLNDGVPASAMVGCSWRRCRWLATGGFAGFDTASPPHAGQRRLLCPICTHTRAQ